MQHKPEETTLARRCNLREETRNVIEIFVANTMSIGAKMGTSLLKLRQSRF
jgi:hypothetical protein